MLKKESRNWAIIENEGEKIFAVLHAPRIENPPVVIIMHGFASHKIGTGRSYVKLASALAESNIACLRFDFRGFGDSEGDPSKMHVNAFISDIEAVVAYLHSQGFQKIGFFGSSFGASMAVLAASKAPAGAIGALALWSPVATGELWYRDFLTQQPQLASINPHDALSTFRGIKLSEEFREQFGSMRADKALEKLMDIPLLHLQGEKDHVTSLLHQKAFQEERKGSSAPTSFITYPDTDHWLGQSKILPEVTAQVVNWFKKYL